MNDADTFENLPIDVRPDLDSLISKQIASGKFMELAANPFLTYSEKQHIGRVAESLKQEYQLTTDEAMQQSIELFNKNRR